MVMVSTIASISLTPSLPMCRLHEMARFTFNVANERESGWEWIGFRPGVRFVCRRSESMSDTVVPYPSILVDLATTPGRFEIQDRISQSLVILQ